MTIVTARCSMRRFISSALWPSTTTISPTLLCLNTPTIVSIKVVPWNRSNAFGWPMRLDSPAARTTATIMRAMNGVSLLVIDAVDKTAFLELPHDAVVDDIVDAQCGSRLSRQGVFDLHLHPLPRD